MVCEWCALVFIALISFAEGVGRLFSKQTGNALLESSEDAGKFFYLLKKA